MNLLQHVTSRRSASQKMADGFSLLELVVAVSIMLILGVVGFVAYQNYTDNARQAAVQTSADEVLTAVIAADNTPNGDPVAAVESFNSTSTDIVADIAVANTNNLTVRAMTCAGDTGTARTAGDYSHLETTAFQNVEYEWLGEPGNSASTMSVCGEIIQTNYAPYGKYNLPVREGWFSNNTIDLSHTRVSIDDHPQGITTARQQVLKQEGLDKSRDNFYSDYMMGGVPLDSDYDYMGAWVWANRDAELVLGKRFPDDDSELVSLPANTWKFVVFPKDLMAGVTMFFADRDHPADAADAIGRVTGVIATQGEPPTAYFDGDTR